MYLKMSYKTRQKNSEKSLIISNGCSNWEKIINVILKIEISQYCWNNIFLQMTQFL